MGCVETALHITLPVTGSKENRNMAECTETPSDDKTKKGGSLLSELTGLVSLPGVYKGQSYGSIGWAIRVITRVTDGGSVELNDGISFHSPCFKGAAVGDVWAVNHERGGACFGRVNQAILLQPSGR